VDQSGEDWATIVFACICCAVTVDEVHSAIDSGAHTVDAISDATDAGTGCGTCHDRLEGLIEGRVGCPLAALRVA
jgi:bacterioferritin-associated ferredoxin